MGAAAIAEGRGGRSGGAGAAAGAGGGVAAARTPGRTAVTSAGDGDGVGGGGGAARGTLVTTAVKRPLSGTMRILRSPRPAAYSNSVSCFWSIWSADSDGAISASRA